MMKAWMSSVITSASDQGAGPLRARSSSTRARSCPTSKSGMRSAMLSPIRLLPRDLHLGDDEPVIRARLEGYPSARAVDHDFLEELQPRLFLVDDGRGLRVQRLAFLGIERVAGLLHEVVEALSGLAADPVLPVEAG